jgi:hypothetical protein
MHTLTRFACLAATLGLASMTSAQQQPANDAAPANPQTPSVFADTAQGNGSYLALGDLVLGPLNVGTPTADTGCLGVDEFNGKFYVTGRSTAATARKIYRFDTAGALEATFTQNSTAGSAWGHRDLASDEAGNLLYGGEENGHIAEYAVDGLGNLSAGTAYSIPAAGVIRALTRDPNGTKAFWTANFTGAIFAFTLSPTPTVTGTFGNPGKAFYGLATNPNDDNFVWGFSQNGAAAPINTDWVQFSEMNRSLSWALTGVSFNGTFYGVTSTNIAGGADFWDDGTDATFKLVGLHQHTIDEINVYDSAVVAGTATTTFCTAKPGLVCGVPAISASGTSSVTASSGFVISASPARSDKSGILMYNTVLAGAPVPFQGGTLCVEPMNLRRAGSTNSGAGTGPGPSPACGPANCLGVLSVDMNAFSQGSAGLCAPNPCWVVPDCFGTPSGIPANNPAGYLLTPGTTVHCQYQGRDSVATGSLVSDGLTYTIGP